MLKSPYWTSTGVTLNHHLFSLPGPSLAWPHHCNTSRARWFGPCLNFDWTRSELGSSILDSYTMACLWFTSQFFSLHKMMKIASCANNIIDIWPRTSETNKTLYYPEIGWLKPHPELAPFIQAHSEQRC
jgi:hypothetical protein